MEISIFRMRKFEIYRKTLISILDWSHSWKFRYVW